MIRNVLRDGQSRWRKRIHDSRSCSSTNPVTRWRTSGWARPLPDPTATALPDTRHSAGVNAPAVTSSITRRAVAAQVTHGSVRRFDRDACVSGRDVGRQQVVTDEAVKGDGPGFPCQALERGAALPMAEDV